jgi:hypothetical protein
MKKAKAEEAPKKYKKMYTERDVAKVVHKKAITLYGEKKGGGPSGSTEFLRVYPHAVTRIIGKLPPAGILELQRTAEKWTQEGPPEEVKLAYVSVYFII